MAVSENDLLVGPLVPASGVTSISLDFDGTDWEASWLEVYKSGSETPLVLNTDYTVTDAGTIDAIVVLTTPANGVNSYSIYLVTPLQRSSDMQLRGEFKSGPFNIEMDRLWQAVQHLRTLIGSKFGVVKTDASPEPVSASANRYLGFDADGAFALFSSAPASSTDGEVLYADRQSLLIGTEVSRGVGSIWRAGQWLFEEAASGASDHHETTAGGVKLYETGIHYTTIQRLKDAVSRGVDFSAGDPVLAAGALLVFLDDGNTKIPDLTGWKSIVETDNETRLAAIEAVQATGALARAYSKGIPVGDITLPAVFPDWIQNLGPYWDGAQTRFRIDPYDYVDFTKDGTLTVNEYWVNTVTGSNGNAGTSSGAAWATLIYAIANATSPAIIYIEDELLDWNAVGNTLSPDGLFKIVGAHSSGAPTRVTNMLNTQTKATFNWNNEGGGVWSTSAATTTATIFGRLGTACWDNKFQDEHGLAMPLPDVGSQAACAAQAGTQFHDTANSKKYVHLLDGREPDPADGWMYSWSQSGLTLLQVSDTGVVLLENFRFYRNAKNSSSVNLRYRHNNSTSANNSTFGAKNVSASGGSGDNFQIMDCAKKVLVDCHSRYAHHDGIDGSSFVTAGEKGRFIEGLEWNCSSLKNGANIFAEHVALTGSDNGFTCHSSQIVTRFDCIAADCEGAVFADVNGCLTFMANCFGARPGGDWDIVFWSENYLKGTASDTGMYLLGCGAFDDGDATVDLISNINQAGGSASDGQVYVSHWRGQIDGGVTGTLKDFSGADL